MFVGSFCENSFFNRTYGQYRPESTPVLSGKYWSTFRIGLQSFQQGTGIGSECGWGEDMMNNEGEDE